MSLDLIQQVESLTKKLDTSVKSLRNTGTEYAQAEQNYRIALTEEILKLKDNGEKATILEVIAKGKPNIAKLRYQRDVAEALYKANLESINALKVQIKIIDNQISREWSNDNN